MLRKSSFFKLTTAALLLTNTALLLILFMKPGVPPPPKPEKQIARLLAFNDEQLAQFKELVHEHRKETANLQKQLVANKIALYKELSAANTQSRDSFLQEITILTGQIEGLHFSHFSKVKAICNPDQMEAFERLTDELHHFLMPPKHKR